MRAWKPAEQIAARCFGAPESLGRVERKPLRAPIYGRPFGPGQLKLGRLDQAIGLPIPT